MGWTGRPKNDHLRGPALRDARGVSKLRGDEPHPAVWVRWSRGQESASRARVQGYTARQSDNTSQPGDDTPTHNPRRLGTSAIARQRTRPIQQDLPRRAGFNRPARERHTQPGDDPKLRKTRVWR